MVHGIERNRIGEKKMAACCTVMMNGEKCGPCLCFAKSFLSLHVRC